MDCMDSSSTPHGSDDDNEEVDDNADDEGVPSWVAEAFMTSLSLALPMYPRVAVSVRPRSGADNGSQKKKENE